MSDENIKQVIVARTKYPDGKGGTMGLRTGKLIAQCCHASMKVFFDKGHVAHLQAVNGTSFLIEFLTPAMEQWITGRFTKICVYVKSEEELLNIVQKATDACLPVALITDAGLTEFKGIPTKTCCAIGPAPAEEIDKITGELPLL